MKMKATAWDLSLALMSCGQTLADENDIELTAPVAGTPEGGIMDQLGVSRDDIGVDWNSIDNNWDAFRQMASKRWRELTVEDWSTIEGNRESILGILGERTGQPTGELKLELQTLVERL